MKPAFLSALAAVAVLVSSPATAAVTITDYAISGNTFVYGTFSLAHDDALPDVFTLTALNLTTDPLTWDLGNPTIAVTSTPTPGQIEIRGGCFTGFPCSNFRFTMTPAELTQFSTVSWDFLGVRVGSSTVPIVQVGTGVPEPATWAIMLFGFGAVGFAMRRKPTWIRSKEAIGILAAVR